MKSGNTKVGPKRSVEMHRSLSWEFAYAFLDRQSDTRHCHAAQLILLVSVRPARASRFPVLAIWGPVHSANQLMTSTRAVTRDRRDAVWVSRIHVFVTADVQQFLAKNVPLTLFCRQTAAQANLLNSE